MKIGLFVVCWNESRILPYMMKYWRNFADHVHIFDNGSDDGCLEEFAKYPDWITVHPYETGGEINDKKLIDLKNSAWKPYRDEYDLVVMCDFDEALYSPDIMADFQAMVDGGFTIARPKCCDLCCLSFPDVKDGQYLHEAVGKYTRLPMNDKCLIFNPKEIEEISYYPGAHKCNPKGNVRMYDGCRIVQFHCKNLGIDYALYMKNRSCARLSRLNKLMKYGIHYTYSDEKLKSDITNLVRIAFKVNRLF